MKEDMQITGQMILTIVKDYIESIEKNGLTNEGFFLDWEDELNKLSVKY